MKQVNDRTRYFYPSKIKNTLFVIYCLPFVALGIISCVGGYQEEIYVVIPIGAVLILIFGLGIFFLIKRIFNGKPYLILTDNVLMIHSFFSNEIPIKREVLNRSKLNDKISTRLLN